MLIRILLSLGLASCGCVEKARQLAGLKGYVANIPISTKTGAAVIAAYHDLFEVEKSPSGPRLTADETGSLAQGTPSGPPSGRTPRDRRDPHQPAAAGGPTAPPLPPDLEALARRLLATHWAVLVAITGRDPRRSPGTPHDRLRAVLTGP